MRGGIDGLTPETKKARAGVPIRVFMARDNLSETARAGKEGKGHLRLPI